MLYLITPCTRPQNLHIIYGTIPVQCHWIIVHDNSLSDKDFQTLKNVYDEDRCTIMSCDSTGKVGTKARNYVLDNFNFDDEDHILFHDDDNIIHTRLYPVISQCLKHDFSVLRWGQLKKNNEVRIKPSSSLEVGYIDTACFLVKWKYNKNVRHRTDTYDHDCYYARDCSANGQTLIINEYLSYYNYLSKDD